MKSIREEITNLKHWTEDGDETDEPATLEEKFDALLDTLDTMDVQIHNNTIEFDEFKHKWMNHRHTVEKGLYSGKAER